MKKMTRDQIRDLCENKYIWEKRFLYDDTEPEGLYCYKRADGQFYVANDNQTKTYTVIYIEEEMFDNGEFETIVLYINDGDYPFFRKVCFGAYRSRDKVNPNRSAKLYGCIRSLYVRTKGMLQTISMGYWIAWKCLELYCSKKMHSESVYR